MGTMEIVGFVLLALVVMGIVGNWRDILKYIHISNM
jgi:hypothetical protein